ncbi:MAG: hypothetical protein FWB80_02700 [Defluviitaleaceae bacterium]|nr:hypothetical protein [Defluviitaleaceae bacterium]
MLPPLNISTWKEESLSALSEKILSMTPTPLILIDGVGGSGKTTLAKKLADMLNANIVSTDDVAWYADPIHWDEELLTGIIHPWQNGENIAYKPSGWIKKNRNGCITAAPNKALIIEGSGACRKTLRKSATYSIWVDTKSEVARDRVIRRDLANGENGGTLESVTEFTDWWDSIADPFLLEESAWKYVNIIISGEQSDLASNTVSTSLP